MRRSLVTICRTIAAVLFIAVSLHLSVSAQQVNTFSISGTVYEYTQGNDSVPVEFAMVAIPDFGIAATTDIDGHYTLKGVPRGKAVLKVSYVGKVTIDRPVDVTGPMTIDFTLREENFKLKEVMVTAQMSQAGGATSSLIGRNAMDHMQAASLDDVMSLLPGGTSRNPELDEATTLSLRKSIATIGSNTSPAAKSGAEAMNALGTAIIRDGAPVSANANLSAMNPAMAGSTSSIAIGNVSSNKGVDLRTLSTDNIESVEVIRGIPSVEHGDLTSGAVIINSKAGREPLRITAKANPKLYMGSVSTGFNLGKNRGGLNISADYAHNTNDPVESYDTYQRVTSRVMYSKEFNQKLRSNTSVNFLYGKNERALNPDDVDSQRASGGEDYGVTLNTNGLWTIDKGWLKSIRYVASGTYTSRQSYSQRLVTTTDNPPYSGSMVDGSVITNVAGQHIFDAAGNEITNFGPEDADKQVYYFPKAYFSRYNIDSREVNVFGKLVATLFKQSGYINNRMLLGADFRSDGNVGHGKQFSPDGPPMREISLSNASYRPRDYRDIPFINQLGLFAEENFMWQLGLHELRLQAGVRYDHANIVGGIATPRFNASFEILPNKLWIRGGYGIAAKMPTMLYLYPETTYFEYVNLNEMTKDTPLMITTTKAYDTSNENLKIATNRKCELAFDLRLGRTTFNITGFYEKLKNGYSLSRNFNSFSQFMWTEYSRDANGELVEKSTTPVLSSWYSPGNDISVTTRGVEFDLQLSRFEKINTTVSLNGAWMRTKSGNSAYTFDDVTDSKNATSRKDIAIYAANSETFYEETMSTALRITHNLPRIGFVVTLTGQAVWKDANWGKYNNYDIPVGYMSLQDGQPHFFDEGQFASIDDFKASEWGYLYKNRIHTYEIREKYHPYFCFNMNVTKELGDLMRVSFFANNMFRSYPRRPYSRELGTYKLLNNRFYFGVELAITL